MNKQISINRTEGRNVAFKNGGKITFNTVSGERVMDMDVNGSTIRFHAEELNRRAGDRYTQATLIGNDQKAIEIFNTL